MGNWRQFFCVRDYKTKTHSDFFLQHQTHKKNLTFRNFSYTFVKSFGRCESSESAGTTTFTMSIETTCPRKLFYFRPCCKKKSPLVFVLFVPEKNISFTLVGLNQLNITFSGFAFGRVSEHKISIYFQCSFES